jgi:hypothetical protein
MKRVMPSRVVKTIDALFSHAGKGVGVTQVRAAQDIPPELLSFSAEDYAEFVLAVSAIKSHLEMWASTGGKQQVTQPVNRRDAVTVIRRVLALCPDEYPPPSTTTFLFITDRSSAATSGSRAGNRLATRSFGGSASARGFHPPPC